MIRAALCAARSEFRSSFLITPQERILQAEVARLALLGGQFAVAIFFLAETPVISLAPPRFARSR